MTPEFEKRLKIKKEEWSSDFSESSSIPYYERCAYDEGARWGYQQGIRDAVEKLRQGDWHGLADTLEREMLGEER